MCGFKGPKYTPPPAPPPPPPIPEPMMSPDEAAKAKEASTSGVRKNTRGRSGLKIELNSQSSGTGLSVPT